MKNNKSEISPTQGEVSGKPNDQAQLRAAGVAPENKTDESGALAAASCSPAIERRFKAAIISESGKVVWWINYDDPNAISHKRWTDLIGMAVNQALGFGLRNEALYLLSNARPCSKEIESVLRETTSPKSVPKREVLEYTLNPSADKNSINLEDSDSIMSKESSELVSKSALISLNDLDKSMLDEFLIWDGGKSVDEQANDTALAQPPTKSAGDAGRVEAAKSGATESEGGCCQQRIVLPFAGVGVPMSGFVMRYPTEGYWETWNY